MRISGKSFDVMVGDLLINFESINASISDNRKAVFENGVPNGYVDGDVSCSGELEIDAKNFNLLVEVARTSGSWRELEPFDIIGVAKTSKEEQKHELFGCLINISDLLTADKNGGEKTKHKLPFEVTSPDFVRINGVPYLSAADTRNL